MTKPKAVTAEERAARIVAEARIRRHSGSGPLSWEMHWAFVEFEIAAEIRAAVAADRRARNRKK